MTTINHILRYFQEQKSETAPCITIASYLLFFLILFFIISLPSLHVLSFIAGWYNEKRLAQIIILTALVAVLISSKHFQHHTLSTLTDLSGITKLLLIIFFVFGAVSSTLSMFPVWAFLELGNYFLLGLLALFISYSIQNNNNAERIIIIAFCITVMLYIVAFLASLVAGLSNGVMDYHYLLSGFTNRRFLNQFQGVSFPILLVAPLFLNPGKRGYFILSALAAFWFMLMLVSDGRGVILASAIGLGLSFTLTPSSGKKWFFHIIFVVTLGILLFLGFDYLLSSNEVIKGDVLRDTSGGRLAIWLQLIETIKENPTLGIGPMHYAIIPHPFTIAHPHNITLQLITEYGIPAAVSVFFVVLVNFIAWVKHQKKLTTNNQSLIPAALMASFIAAVVHGHLSGVFVMPLSQLSFVLTCGWMISISSKNRAPKRLDAFSLKHRAIITLVAILALSALLTGSYPHFKSFITGEELKAANPDIEYPASNASRYWSGTYL